MSGLILILLGAWGGLIPLVGPYVKFGYTPNRTWDLTQGRLYLSVIPGAVALLAGLVILMTRSRGLGGFCAFVAALAGSWFIAGAAVIALLPASLSGSISTGTPITTTASRAILTELAFYGGLGALILFFAALALGRFSISPAREHSRLADDLAGVAGVGGLAGVGAVAYDAYSSGQPTQSYSPGQTRYESGQDVFSPSQDTFPSQAEQYPTSPSPFQGSSQDPFSAGTQPYVSSQDPFPGSNDPYSPGQGQ